MTDRELGDDEIASRASVDRSTISKIRRKKQKPSPELAALLIAISENAITWPELYGLAVPDAQAETEPALPASPIEEAA